jgi:hypothetical protein
VEAAGAGELLADFDDEGSIRSATPSATTSPAPEGLASGQSKTGESSTALRRTRRLAANGPLIGQPARELVRPRALGSGCAAALAAKARLRGQLAADLQIAPSAVTRELADRIRAGDELLSPLAIPPMTAVPGTCSFR